MRAANQTLLFKRILGTARNTRFTHHQHIIQHRAFSNVSGNSGSSVVLKEYSNVLVQSWSDTHPYIVKVSMNQGRSMNALSVAMMKDLIDALKFVQTGKGEVKDARVVVLHGNGAAFSAGHDLKEIRAAQEHNADQLPSIFDTCTQLMNVTRQCDIPVYVIFMYITQYLFFCVFDCVLAWCIELQCVMDGQRLQVCNWHARVISVTPHEIAISRLRGLTLGSFAAHRLWK